MKRYPLGSVVDLRQRETQRRTIEHAEAASVRRQAQAALERARARTRELEQELAETLLGEDARGEEGRLRAVDLARAEAFRREATRRIDVSRAKERAAEEHLGSALSGEVAARSALAGSRGDEQAIREHEVRFVRDERRREEERETEDTLSSGAYRGRLP